MIALVSGVISVAQPAPALHLSKKLPFAYSGVEKRLHMCQLHQSVERHGTPNYSFNIIAYANSFVADKFIAGNYCAKVSNWPKVVLGSLTLKWVPPIKLTSHLGEVIFGKPAICSTKAGVVLSAEMLLLRWEFELHSNPFVQIIMMW